MKNFKKAIWVALTVAALGFSGTLSTPAHADSWPDGTSLREKKPKPEPTPTPKPGPREGGADD